MIELWVPCVAIPQSMQVYYFWQHKEYQICRSIQYPESILCVLVGTYLGLYTVDPHVAHTHLVRATQVVSDLLICGVQSKMLSTVVRSNPPNTLVREYKPCCSYQETPLQPNPSSGSLGITHLFELLHGVPAPSPRPPHRSVLQSSAVILLNYPTYSTQHPTQNQRP